MHDLLFVAAVIYFVPTLEAIGRRTPSWDGIMLLNILLGWTVIGWVVALIWAWEARSQN